jgi:hypothetical protein
MRIFRCCSSPTGHFGDADGVIVSDCSGELEQVRQAGDFSAQPALIGRSKRSEP